MKQFQPSLLDDQALGSFTGDHSYSSPRELATNRGKVIEWRDVNRKMEGGGPTGRHELEGRGFKSQCLERFLSLEISDKM